jgi:tRNA A58 N-methylase Trm61
MSRLFSPSPADFTLITYEVAEGFGQDLLEKADAVFLDLPTPWLAIEHVIGVFRKSGRVNSIITGAHD